MEKPPLKMTTTPRYDLAKVRALESGIWDILQKINAISIEAAMDVVCNIASSVAVKCHISKDRYLYAIGMVYDKRVADMQSEKS